jgi:hypothetical protein
MRNLLPITITFLLSAVTAFAQGATAIATTHTPVYIAPDTTRTPLRTAAQGTVFTVVEEEGEWTKVQFKDPQWGVRVGYVKTGALRFSRPELAPMDLSTTPAVAPVPSPQTVSPSPATPRPWEVPEPADSFERVWIDVNLGVAIAAEKTFAIEYSDTIFRETRTFRASYENPTGASFDFGGGVMFTPEIGAGVSFSGTAHRGTPELYVSVPHPNFFNSAASDTSEADREFERVEGGINIQLMGVAKLGDRARLRVFGGPTYFRVQQDLVSDIRYAQVFGIFTRANEVAIADYEYVEKVEGTGWGFHVGADVSVFFTRVVGIGGFARYSQGKVDVTQPATLDSVELKAGGWQTGGGLRLKF